MNKLFANHSIKLFLTLFIVFFCFLSLNRHSKSGIYGYHSEIWADKAGYYVYLPAAFIYQFNTKDLPDSIDTKTGIGFKVDKENNKILTKYTYGVALMQLPFFLVAHISTQLLNFEANGFSIIYHKLINIAAVSYCAIGMVFLFLFLKKFVDHKIALLSITSLYLGSNIFYYAIFETGMSHIYSFCLFSIFLYLTDKVFKSNTSIYTYILFGLIVGLILMVRPVNIIFLPVFFLFNKINFKILFNSIVPIAVMITTCFIIVIPQLFYWKYVSGSYFTYSYGNESFTYLLSPKMIELWFSTNNGLFPFNPIFIFVFIGMAIMYKHHKFLSSALFIYFLLLSYILASWWCWYYGCSYGSRPFVEYYVLFALPFSYSIKYILEKKGIKNYALITVLIICIALNLKFMFTTDGCWYGGDWDWKEYYSYIVGNTK